MAYQVLARKYRPQLFSDVIGQDHVTRTLLNALAQGRIAHGYIFSGHRGIGKTTIARILAAALNCSTPVGSAERPTEEPCRVCVNCREISSASRQENSIFEESHSFDVEEIDAATNRGIDDARLLTSKIQTRPTNKSKYKIIILDEAHQITDAAFNALLKTLEEPPDHIVFMMATTQPEDIPQTVRSRCQHFSFHAVKLADILGELRGIAEHEGVEADESALSLLAEAGDGSMRDALSIMDQAIASAPLVEGKARLDAGQIRELMGTVPNAVFERVMQAVDANRSAEVMTVANELLDAGNSPAQLARQAVRYLRSCVIAKITGLTPESGDSELLQISPEEQRRAARTAALFTEEELTRFLQTMLRTFDELGYRQEQRFHFELGLLKLVHLRRLLPVEEVLSTMGGSRPASAASLPRASSPGPVSVPRPSAPAAPAKPAFSPFEQDKNRRRYDGIQGSSGANALASSPVTVAAPVVRPAPVMAPPLQMPEPVVMGVVEAYEEPVVAPEVVPVEVSPMSQNRDMGHPDSGDTAEVERMQRAVVEALGAAKQGSAADCMGDAVWTFADGEARVQTDVSKTMLPVRINPEADKIARGALRALGVNKLTVLAGASTGGAEKKPRSAKAGSAQAKALEHPMVQEAQRLFEAEIQTVFDLTENG